MAKPMTSDEKFRQMTETPIPKLIATLSVPTIISMLISALYNMADTYFVGMLHNASATAAVGIIFPVMSILQAVGFMFGHGSGNYISRALGGHDTDDAEKMAATGFFSSLIMGVAITALGILFLDPLLRLLGSSETILPHAEAYAFYILLGAPWMVSSLTLNNQLRFQGNAFYGMIGMVAGAVLNIALDPLFIFTFGMGVAGAALATMFSQFVSFVILLLGTRQGSSIRIRLRHFTPTKAIYREILRGGVPSLARQGLGSVSIILLNTASGVYGDAAIAAMSIVSRVMQMAGSAIIGFGQGFQPVCGFNYGAAQYARVRQAFWFCVKLACGLLIVIGTAAIIFAPSIIGLFQRNDPEVIRIGATALRLQCIFLPTFSFVIMSNMMLQTMGIAGRASLLAVARQGLFLIPALLVLPQFFGLLGVQLAQPVADVLSFLLALPLSLGVLKELKEKEQLGCAPELESEFES